MWTRADLKQRAKAVLRGSYWKAFLVSLIVGFASGGAGGGGGGGGSSSGNGVTYKISDVDWEFILPFIGIIASVAFIAVVASICIRVFLGYPLIVGGTKYFLNSAGGKVNLNYIGFSFAAGKYLNIIKTMLYRDVLVFLWTLLFIIPGIIKSYAYRMVPYILADNPNIKYNRAVEISNIMTANQKFEIFVLDISFIGWYILGTMALFVGVLFVAPYDRSTKAELYVVLREKAISEGLNPSELMLMPREQLNNI